MMEVNGGGGDNGTGAAGAAGVAGAAGAAGADYSEDNVNENAHVNSKIEEEEGEDIGDIDNENNDDNDNDDDNDDDNEGTQVEIDGKGESEGESATEIEEEATNWEDLHGHLEHQHHQERHERPVRLNRPERPLIRIHNHNGNGNDNDNDNSHPHYHKDALHLKLPNSDNNNSENSHSDNNPNSNLRGARPRPERPRHRMERPQHEREHEREHEHRARRPDPLPHRRRGEGGEEEDSGGLFDKIKDTMQNLMPDMHANDVFNGRAWSKAKFESYGEASGGASAKNNIIHNYIHNLLKRPPPAVIDEYLEDKNVNVGEIFVSLPSLKDGGRCGDTLLSLYKQAKNPLKVFVGIVEQNHPTDTTSCIEHYCHLQQQQQQQQQDQQQDQTSAESCPYRNQISIIQLSPWLAKGPSYARALAQRKLLANQQFCLSIDAHSKFTQDWDDVSINQWTMIDNEFAVLSNQPASDLEKDLIVKKKEESKLHEIKDWRQRKREEIHRRKEEEEEEDLFSIAADEYERRIYRNCNILFNDYSIPYYFIHKKPPIAILKGRRPDRNEKHRPKKLHSSQRRKLRDIERGRGEMRPRESYPRRKRPPRDFGANGLVQDLSQPLLSYSWSSSFSFSKCHLDTNVPYDNFITQFFDTESFTRYARMFTRGYDVYTPSTNIVYHDYNPLVSVGKTMDNYIKVSWAHSEMERRDSIERVHTMLGIHKMNPKNDEHLQKQQGNLGIYGLGKLRSLKQLEEFVDINLQRAEGHYTVHHLPTCANLKWVPYSLQEQEGTLTSASPMDLKPEGDKNMRALLSASAMDNLYAETDDLDPQPEFSNRKVSRIPLSTYYNKPSHSISTHGPTWSGYSNWTDFMVFLVLMLSLLAMRKIINGDRNNDIADLSYLFTDKRKINTKGKEKKSRGNKKIV